MEQREQRMDWSPVEIRDAIKATGISVDELAGKLGCKKASLYQAMKSDGYRRYEEMIALYLGLTVENIWPARVAARREKAERRERSLLKASELAIQQVA